MNRQRLRELLEKVQTGLITLDEGLHQLERLPFENIDYARVDHHRGLRTGLPEAIFCQGKTVDQVREIALRLYQEYGLVLATRADEAHYEALATIDPTATYHQLARMVTIGPPLKKEATGTILVVSAGTSDIPVAEEAVITSQMLGNRVERLYDVGVAGVHRLLAQQDQLKAANVIIVVAGMEGALASVVGGLVRVPVIAVPTSVGYGAAFGGLAALLGMLNSCAPGVGVVNIDNGFGAACLADKIIGVQGNTEKD